MRDKSRSRAVRFFCYVTTAHFEINRVLLSFRAAAKLPGRMNPATFRLNALMARRFVSAAEHHTLQQAGPVERKKKTAGRWRWGGSVSTTCCNRQNSARTAQDILLLRVKEQKCFKTAYPPSLPAWGVHTALWEGFELTQVTVAPSPVWRRKRRGRRREGMNNSTSQCCSALTSCVLWGGEASRQQQQAAPPHMTARGYSIQGTSIFPRTGHHFREQQ